MKFKYRNKYEWHNWFAWRPVRIGNYFSSNDIVWLQFIERRREQYSYSYRLLNKYK